MLSRERASKHELATAPRVSHVSILSKGAPGSNNCPCNRVAGVSSNSCGLRVWRPLTALKERGRTHPLRPPCFANRTSAFFFLPDLAIDEMADIVVILFLFLEERIVGGFNLDIIVRHDHDLVLAGIGYLK